MIKVNNLQKSFKNLTVLKDITTEIHKGDVISVKNRKSSLEAVKLAVLEARSEVPDYLAKSENEVPSGTVLRLPEADDVAVPVDARGESAPFQPQLIVELCSK